jgi:hypothetical protein
MNTNFKPPAPNAKRKYWSDIKPGEYVYSGKRWDKVISVEQQDLATPFGTLDIRVKAETFEMDTCSVSWRWTLQKRPAQKRQPTVRFIMIERNHYPSHSSYAGYYCKISKYASKAAFEKGKRPLKTVMVKTRVNALATCKRDHPKAQIVYKSNVIVKTGVKA